MVKCVTCGWVHLDGKGCPKLEYAHKRAVETWNEYSYHKILEEDEDGNLIYQGTIEYYRNPEPVPEWLCINWFLEERDCEDYHPWYERPDFK